jgi:DNA polymerase-3 subunit gamma/tau
MALLRMLAFRPADTSGSETGKASSAATTSSATPMARSMPAAPATRAIPDAPVAARAAPTDSNRIVADAEDWLALIAASGLKGPVMQLASHCSFIGHGDGVLRVHLADEDAHLRSESLVRQLVQALGATLGSALQLRFEAQSGSGDTLHRRSERQRGERQVAAEARFRADPVVEALLGQGGTIVPDSIRPLSEN